MADKRAMVMCLVYLHPETPTPGNAAGMVLLVRKREPQWQRGKWNGPGGVIEPAELVVVAASRELLEETGIHVKPSEWEHVASLSGSTFAVEVVKYHFPRGALPDLLAMSPEEAYAAGREWAQWFPIETLPRDGNEYGEQRHPDRRGGCVYDLTWLVPLSLDGRFFAPTFRVKPQVEHKPENQNVAPCIGGRETNTVKLPCDVKVGGTVVGSGTATVNRALVHGGLPRRLLETLPDELPAFPVDPASLPTDETEADKFPAAKPPAFMSKGLREKLYAADAEIARKEAEQARGPMPGDDAGPNTGGSVLPKG